jgi:hypothetical protein
MAVRIENLGGTPINFGEVELKSEDWNDSFNEVVKLGGILIFDNSTDLDFSNTSINTTVTKNKDYVFSAEDVSKVGKYLVIRINGKFFARVSGSTSDTYNGTIKLRVKKTSQTAENIYVDESFVSVIAASATGVRDTNTVNSFETLYEIKEEDIINGLTINVEIDGELSSTGTGSGRSVSFTNRQIIFKSTSDML